MNDIEFADINELYERLLPALKTKVSDFHKIGCGFVTIEFLWNTLVNLKWKNASALELCDMVDQILHISVEEICECHVNFLNK